MLSRHHDRRVLHSSESSEWYTPAHVVEIARDVMGSIDLDPASSHRANRVVKADAIFTVDSNGLGNDWWGNVWLNPPYGKTAGKSNAGIWFDYLVSQYQRGNVEQGCVLINSSTGNKWFSSVWRHPVCFFGQRIKFVPAHPSERKRSPTHSNVMVYLGVDVDVFVDVLSPYGTVVLPRGSAISEVV